MEKVNSDIFVRNIAEKTGYSIMEARNFVRLILERFREFLKNQDRIEIRGLGTFFVKEHKGRTVRLETKIIDSKNHFITLFKSSSILQQLINKEGAINEDIREE